MTDVFKDQAKFMQACDQTVDKFNQSQFNLYLNLIEEEVKELSVAIENNDRIEVLDALIDIMVVTAGAIHSGAFDAAGAWNEVMRSNFAKIDSNTGKVQKRADGKILKPSNWTPPNLTAYLGNHDI